MDKYIDRRHAGKVLARQLKEYRNNSDVIALALPRGGVPVAYEVAKALSIPLDVYIVRKLGVPGFEELAMGAITSDSILFNEEILHSSNISKEKLKQVIEKENEELMRRKALYQSKSYLVKDKIILLIDDGIATGATMKAAMKGLRIQKPAKIIVAVPVAALSTCEELSQYADKIICPLKPIDFQAVGLWYTQFSQTSDEEVCELLGRAKRESGGTAGSQETSRKNLP